MPATRIPRPLSSSAPDTRDHVHAGLGRTVGDLALARLLSVDRRDVDDDAGAALLEHVPGAVLDAVEDPAERHRMDRLPLLVRQFGQGRDESRSPRQLTTMSSDPNASRAARIAPST